MASIVLSSTSFSNGALINPQFKSTHCSAPNLSPEFHWELFGISPIIVDYFDLLVEDITMPGSSPSGHFIHWAARIPSGIQNIPENGAWGTGVTLTPTDWGSGDNFNGWNGPCAINPLHTYHCYITAKINDAYLGAPYGCKTCESLPAIIRSRPLIFIDTIHNNYTSPTDYCGNMVCPPGYQLNPQQECERVIQAAAIGAECPQNFTYNPVSGFCEQILIELPVLTECCWKIQNCQTEEYLYIQMDPTVKSPIYVNDVYAFGGNPIFADTCYRVIQQVVNQVPDYNNITIESNFGAEGCVVCEQTEIFDSCDKPGHWVYVTLLQPYALVIDQVYKLSGLNGCYKYVGPGQGQASQYNVTVIGDYKSKDCLVCDNCFRFKDCVTGQNVNVNIIKDPIPTIDDLNNVYELAGDLQLMNRCWIFTGFATCIGAINAEIVQDYECTNCAICLPAYLLTNCADPTDVYRIGWPKEASPLAKETAYIFDFLGDGCYTAQPLIRDCDSEYYPLYNSSNIVTSYVDCATCNKACYKITDCIDPNEVYWIDQDLSSYVDHIVQWTDGINIKCGLVESYTCRLESYPEPQLFTLLDCFKTCEKCLPQPIVEDEFTISHRVVSPGRQVPPCDTTSTINYKCDE